MKKWYANLSPEEKVIVRTKNNEAKKKWDANLTSKQKELRNEKERNRYKDNPTYRRKCASRSLFNRIGMSLEQKEELLASQGNKCASCGSPDPGGKGGWHTDHDHNTNFIRSILCVQCNTLLGFLEKQSTRVEQLKAYLNFKPNYTFEVL